MTKNAIDIELDREDVILFLLEANERLLGRRFLAGITRLEKLVFLLEKETEFEGIARFFPFVAHNFGPFSMEVYEAVDFLEGCDLIQVREKSYATYYASADEARLSSEIMDSEDEDPVEVKEREFSLTDDGRQVVLRLRDAVQARRSSDGEELDGILLKYGAWPLRQLIRYVYRRYPKMTEKSIHPEAERLGN